MTSCITCQTFAGCDPAIIVKGHEAAAGEYRAHAASVLQNSMRPHMSSSLRAELSRWAETLSKAAGDIMACAGATPSGAIKVCECEHSESMHPLGDGCLARVRGGTCSCPRFVFKKEVWRAQDLGPQHVCGGPDSRCDLSCDPPQEDK